MSLRYSIYKVQTSFVSFIFMSAANFYILSHLVELVKNFFQVFSNSFVLLLRSAHKSFITQPFYDITDSSVCQEVFLNFLKRPIHLFAASLRPAYISTAPSICQALFLQISTFFFGAFSQRTTVHTQSTFHAVFRRVLTSNSTVTVTRFERHMRNS